MTLTESARAILSELARDAADDARDEWDEWDESEEHEAGCHCDACLDAIARYWEGEAERAMAMETVPDGEHTRWLRKL